LATAVWVNPQITRFKKTGRDESDRGILSRDPAELGSPTKDGVVYLDDLAEVSSKVAVGQLGKHGKAGYEQEGVKKFKGEIPAHALSMVPPTDSFAQAIYQLDGKYETFEGMAALWHVPNYDSQSGTPLTFKVVGDDKVLWESEPLRKHGTGQQCRVSIKGVKELRVEVHCPGSFYEAWAVWINPRVSKSVTKSSTVNSDPKKAVMDVVYLDDLTEAAVEVGFGSLGKHGSDGAGSEVKFGGEICTHSLFVHAKESGAAFVTYRLGKKYDTFQATAGLRESSTGQRSETFTPMTFSVIGDKKVLWKSRAIQRHGDGQPCSVSVRGVDVLTLQVDCPGPSGEGWSIWVDPRVTLAGETMDDSPTERPVTAKAKKPNPKAFYNCVIGGYRDHFAKEKVYPLLNLSVPNRNLWSDRYAAKLQNLVRGDVSYVGTARLAIPKDGIYEVKAGDISTTIDGVKLPGFRDDYSERVPLKKGLHTIVLESSSYGQPHLQAARIRIVAPETGQEIPLVNLWADVEQALRTPVGGQAVVEISGWQPSEENLVPVNLK
jgi:hypothetical protein